MRNRCRGTGPPRSSRSRGVRFPSPVPFLSRDSQHINAIEAYPADCAAGPLTVSKALCLTTLVPGINVRAQKSNQHQDGLYLRYQSQHFAGAAEILGGCAEHRRLDQH